jgi:hypothetical protein
VIVSGNYDRAGDPKRQFFTRGFSSQRSFAAGRAGNTLRGEAFFI